MKRLSVRHEVGNQTERLPDEEYDGHNDVWTLRRYLDTTIHEVDADILDIYVQVEATGKALRDKPSLKDWLVNQLNEQLEKIAARIKAEKYDA